MKVSRLIYVSGAMVPWSIAILVIFWLGHMTGWALAFALWAVLASQWIGFTTGARAAGWRP